MSKRKGITDIRSYARQHTETAIKTLVGIAASKDATHSARVAAASALLDRGWGRPDQHLEVKGKLEQEIISLVAGLDERKNVPGSDIDEQNKPTIQ